MRRRRKRLRELIPLRPPSDLPRHMMIGLPYRLRDIRSLFQVSCYSGTRSGPRHV